MILTRTCPRSCYHSEQIKSKYDFFKLLFLIISTKMRKISTANEELPYLFFFDKVLPLGCSLFFILVMNIGRSSYNSDFGLICADLELA